MVTISLNKAYLSIWKPSCSASKVDRIYAKQSCIRGSRQRCFASIGSTNADQSRLLLAGFPFNLIPDVRRSLDEASCFDLSMVVCTPSMLDQNLSFVLSETPEVDWLSPMPDDWVNFDVGAPVVIFSNLHMVSQADVVEVCRSACNGIEIQYGSLESMGELTVREALKRVQTTKIDDSARLIVDYDDDYDGLPDDSSDDDDDDYMASAGESSCHLEDSMFFAVDEIAE
jgi:hypothetical protein